MRCPAHGLSHDPLHNCSPCQKKQARREVRNAVVECLKTVRLGHPQAHQNLTVFPLLHDGMGGALMASSVPQRSARKLGSAPGMVMCLDAVPSQFGSVCD